MNQRRLKAAFSDGTVDYLNTEKTCTHAWHITELQINGWARSEALEQQAATHHARSVAKYWKNLKAEVVEIEPA